MFFIKQMTEQVCTYLQVGDGGAGPAATGHSLLGEFDLLMLGGRPLEAERVHCGEKRHERQAAPLGPGQVSPPDENKGRLSPGRGQGSPGMSSLPWAWELGAGRTGLGPCDSKKQAWVPKSPYPRPPALGSPHLPVMGGFLYWALLRCSSTSLGVTQMTCWPFQYLTMLRDWRVLMMSFWVMLVIWLQKGVGADARGSLVGSAGLAAGTGDRTLANLRRTLPL